MVELSLFSEAPSAMGSNNKRPLADRLRPQSLDEVVGQGHLLDASHGVLRRALTSGVLPSIVFWGPPGCGKTTIARLLAEEVGYHFAMISAVTGGVSELKQVFETARQKKAQATQTLLMVDEVHRFNRAQQDAFLPHIEDGTITLVGATTANPSFELNAALLSRCKVLTLKRLDENALEQLLARAESFAEKTLPLSAAMRLRLCELADGDGRYLLGLCEELFALKLEHPIDSVEALSEWLQRRMPLYDKHEDGHFNLISALHKSLRGSDVQAALYWYGRMLHGGEDPLYIVRRLIRFAVEDIGMADPNALAQANAAREAYTSLGSPEGELAITQAVIYLATAPKSNAAYAAHKQVMQSVKQHASHMPPKHILNAPTKLMKQEGYGEGYQYDHDAPEGFSGQNYFPDAMDRQHYYTPKAIGFERDIAKRLEYWQKLRDKQT